jgi:hypothetical protein
MIEQTLTAELAKHIKSLNLAEAKEMLNNLEIEMRRLKANEESTERYIEEYRALRSAVAIQISVDENIQCEELAKAVQAEYKELFPLSHTYARKEPIGDGWFLMVFLGDKESFSNGIEHNDPLRHYYSFSVGAKGLCITTNCVALSSLKPNDSFSYCSHKKLTFRRKEGTKEKVLSGMVKHFQSLRNFVDIEKVNMLDSVKEKYAKF